MYIVSLLGMLVVFAIIEATIFANGGINTIVFDNVPSLLVVLLVASVVLLIDFSLSKFLKKAKLARSTFLSKQNSAEELIQKVLEISHSAKSQGLLDLDDLELKGKFMGRGIQMLIDGYKVELIKELLVKDMQQTMDNRKWGANAN